MNYGKVGRRRWVLFQQGQLCGVGRRGAVGLCSPRVPFTVPAPRRCQECRMVAKRGVKHHTILATCARLVRFQHKSGFLI